MAKSKILKTQLFLLYLILPTPILNSEIIFINDFSKTESYRYQLKMIERYYMNTVKTIKLYQGTEAKCVYPIEPKFKDDNTTKDLSQEEVVRLFKKIFSGQRLVSRNIGGNYSNFYMKVEHWLSLTTKETESDFKAHTFLGFDNSKYNPIIEHEENLKNLSKINRILPKKFKFRKKDFDPTILVYDQVTP